MQGMPEIILQVTLRLDMINTMESGQLLNPYQPLCVHLSTLPERERAVIVARYGLGDDAPMTQRALAARLGLSHQRVQQIEAKALRTLARLRERDPQGILARAVAARSSAPRPSTGSRGALGSAPARS